MADQLQMVVFDVAGTIVVDRDEVNRCLREALAGAGVSVTQTQVNAVMGLAKPEAITRLLDTEGYAADADAVSAIHDDFVTRMLDDYRTSADVCEVPGTTRLFQDLKQAGIAVTLDTGFSRQILDILLERLGWLEAGLIRASIASDEVPRGRPHSDMIQALMKQCQVVDPQRIAKVGDAAADLLEGAQAGCSRVIGVCWGTHRRAELEGFPHTDLVENHAELRACLGL